VSDSQDVNPNRRALLAGFSVAGASLVLGGLPLAGQAQTDDKGPPMKIGVIGAGKIRGYGRDALGKAGTVFFVASPRRLADLVKRAGRKPAPVPRVRRQRSVMWC
jgi:hypothetical protein